MDWALRSLRKVKFWSSRRLSPRLYWHLMGKWRPVAAVTSDHRSIEDSIESGRRVVDLLNQLGVIEPDTIALQIGCGLGRVEYHLHSQVRKCWGVDISRAMVERARRLVPYPNVEFVQSDGRDLSQWPDETFHLVYSLLVFQHLPRGQFDRYLAESAAKLVPGGHLVFQVIVDDTGSHPEPPPNHPYGVRYYRRREVKDKLRCAGFTLVGCTDLDGNPDDGMPMGDVVFCAAKP